MNRNEIKEFIKRGLMFSGLGPIVVGLVLYFVSLSNDDFYLEGWQILLAIISGYLLAFIQAGTSVFHQIERWAPLKRLGLQLLCLYFIYSGTYLINDWLEFNYLIIIIFTVIFILGYLLICLIVLLVNKILCKRFNKSLNS